MSNPFEIRHLATARIVAKELKSNETIESYTKYISQGYAEMKTNLSLGDSDILFDWFGIPSRRLDLDENYLKMKQRVDTALTEFNAGTITQIAYREKFNVFVIRLFWEKDRVDTMKNNYSKYTTLFSRIRTIIIRLDNELFNYMGLEKNIKNFNIGIYNKTNSVVEQFFKLLSQAIECYNAIISVFLHSYVYYPNITFEKESETTFSKKIDDMEQEIIDILDMAKKSPYDAPVDAPSIRPGLEYVGGLKRRRSKFPSYKYYLKTFKTYSKRKFQTFKKKRNYKKTTRRKH